jgi:hypothetical protein
VAPLRTGNDDHAPAVGIREGQRTDTGPVRVDRVDRRGSRRRDPFLDRCEVRRALDVEDQQVVLRRGEPDRIRRVVRMGGELEVQRRTGQSDHDAGEALVVVEGVDDLEAEYVAVERHHLVEPTGGPGDPYLRRCCGDIHQASSFWTDRSMLETTSLDWQVQYH